MSAPATRPGGDPRPTGPELAARIRRAARRAGLTLADLLRPITDYGASMVHNLERAKHPRPDTLARVEALLDGRVIPPRGTLPERRGWAPSQRASAAARAARTRAEAPRLAERSRAVLALLTAAAEAGAPCPRDRAIAAELGLTAESARHAVHRLACDGVIAVQTDRNRRTIRILATGAVTAPTDLSRPDDADPPPRAPLGPRRDPCFRCGVRGDIGCVHQPLELWA